MFTQRDFFSSHECDELLRFYEVNYSDTFRLDWGHESRYQRLLQIQDSGVRQLVSSMLFDEHQSVCSDLGIDNFEPHIMEIFISNYQPEEGVGWHRDRPWFEYDPPYENERVYNFSVNLNSGYEGGSLYVDTIPVPKRVGVCTFFSTGYKHMVEPIQSGGRYSLIGWVYKKAGH